MSKETRKSELMNRAIAIAEATLGGAKYAGKENPNDNHTKSELSAKEKAHTTLGKAHGKVADKHFNTMSKASHSSGVLKQKLHNIRNTRSGKYKTTQKAFGAAQDAAGKADVKWKSHDHKGISHEKAAATAQKMKKLGKHED